MTWTDEQITTTLNEAGGNKAEAARRLTMPVTTLKGRLERMAREGHAPGHFNNGVAEGYLMGKVTVQRNSAGDIERTWERQSPDQERAEEARRIAFEALAAQLPREAPILAPRAANDDLATVYTLTDAHVGMLAWHREGGADWDLGIAEKTLVGCFAEAINSAPNAELAIFNQLGDLLHYDSLTAVTPTSGHILDADGRFAKMVEVAVRVLRRIVNMLLEKHRRVHVIMAEGNHDMASSVWLRTMFKALYENEPRITVDDSALPYYCYRHGETMLAFHHSHIKKLDQLRAHIAAQFAVDWGATKKRYIHTGDKHHSAEKDEMGAKLIQHPTLAARDAYAARGGWHSERYMSAITYHKRFGEVGRVTVSPEMLAA